MAKQNAVRYGHVTFNAAWVASKSFKEFCDHEKHHGFPQEKMKEIYDACKAVVKPEEAVKPVDPAK